ncbi:MAG TPA: hypothetical protein VKW08_22380 [Xanthobacteraceae bacterium]|nr:hypothetical protein [Xanthobacteraceae bacterium]
MNALARYVANAAQARSGLNAGVVIGYVVQAMLGSATAILFLIAVFFVCSDWLGFGATKTAIGMCLVFAALFVVAMIWTKLAKKRTREIAERALLATPPLAATLPVIATGLRLGNTIGWRRLMPVALLAGLATGLATEWTRRERGRADA